MYRDQSGSTACRWYIFGSIYQYLFCGDMAEHIDGISESCEAAGKNLAVMSISMDADDLFDSTKESM